MVGPALRFSGTVSLPFNIRLLRLFGGLKGNPVDCYRYFRVRAAGWAYDKSWAVWTGRFAAPQPAIPPAISRTRSKPLRSSRLAAMDDLQPPAQYIGRDGRSAAFLVFPVARPGRGVPAVLLIHSGTEP